MKLKPSILIFSFVVLIVSCDDSILNTPTNEDRVHGSVSGIITDSVTGEALSGVEIQWAFSGEIQTTKTDTNGWYTIDELVPGEHTITFDGHNITNENDSDHDHDHDHDTDNSMYSISQISVQIPTLNQLVAVAGDGVSQKEYHTEPNGNYYINMSQDVTMYPMNASVKGNIYITPNELETGPVRSGTLVTFTFDESLNIIPLVYTTTTDSLGIYEFTNLPAANHDDNFILVGSYDNSGYDMSHYQGKSISQDNSKQWLYPGITNYLDNIILTEKLGVAPILLSNNFETDDFSINDAITGTFNVALDHTRPGFTLNFDRDEGGHTGDYVVTWSSDGKTFTITPDEPLNFSTSYIIEIDGFSTTGISITWTSATNNNLNFKTQAGIAELSNNLQQYDGSGLSIGKNSSIIFKFTENVSQNMFDDLSYVEGSCSDGTSATRVACDAASATWSFGTPVDNSCNITVTQWNFDSQSSITECYQATISENTVTLSAPSNGWGYKCIDDGASGVTDIANDGICGSDEHLGSSFESSISITYKLYNDNADFNIITNSYTVSIDD